MGARGNPNLWSNMHDDEEASYVLGSSFPFNSISQNPNPPSSLWSQLLFSGAPGEEKGLSFDHFQAKKLGTTWEEEQVLNPSFSRVHHNNLLERMMIKQDGGSCLYGGAEEFHGGRGSASASEGTNWSDMSFSNCVNSFIGSDHDDNNKNNNAGVLDCLSYNKKVDTNKKTHHLPPDHSSESSTSTGGICKKARVQASSQPHLKVRKEKLGDRISALHQIVSPFGKTDTASVLLEAIGYISFLHSQIQALCFPYFGNSSKNFRNHHFWNHGERNSVFPEDPGQLLNNNNNNDSSVKRNGAQNQENGVEKAKDLRSRGLCLVPVSLCHHFGSDNNNNNIGPDFWSSPYATGF